MTQIRIPKIDDYLGFALADAKDGEDVTVLARAALTSDDPLFHRCVRQIAAQHIEAVSTINVDSVFQFLVVMHKDASADAYVNDFPVIAEIIGKDAIQAGQILRDSDVANILALKFLHIKILPSDKVIYCFKVRWKFGLFFDLDRSNDLDIDGMNRTLAILYRRLRFDDAYQSVRSQPVFQRLLRDGWFPFVELLGSDYEALALAYEIDPPREHEIGVVLSAFTPERIARLVRRWSTKDPFTRKIPLIEAGVNAFCRRDQPGYIQCIKTLVPEIEGIIRLHYYGTAGRGRASAKQLMEHILEQCRIKTASHDSLFFEEAFLTYLHDVFFAGFDLAGSETPLSRHSVAHGVACLEDYNESRALQTILTLDQIFFYLT
jgi:hypothetical protein